MIRLFLLAALLIAPVAASDVDHIRALFDSPWPDIGEAPDWLLLMSDIDRIEGLALEEAVVVLGPGHGFNVTRDGIVTLDDGERIDISSPAPFGFVGPVTAGIDPATRRRW